MMNDNERNARLALIAERRAFIAEQQNRRRAQLAEQRLNRIEALENRRQNRIDELENRRQNRLSYFDQSAYIEESLQPKKKEENIFIVIKRTFHR